ncbi:tRNA 2-thiouridine(34) synthase MnmA [Candidatus Kaiserbacteria bacterium]|nr:tRNA 2-thiouridine(34) synthase MnmA [Candidatus Kaiserbacteria bacterium]
MSKQKTVFVGLSGGVDSSVAALRLKHAGYNVVGVFIKVWHPDFMVCSWEEERLDAMRVAASLDIPFLTCNAEAEYKTAVADYFISEYQAGRTPNPDVMCNKEVKFGAFLKFAKANGADYIATGHYARVEGESGNRQLYRGVDTNKDQSYFLWTLTREQLDYCLFPVGDTPKEQIRKEAQKANLNTAKKKDSQGICFLGHVDIPDFLSHYIDLKAGDVVNENGKVVGKHKGVLVYTLGQRHGFEIFEADTNRKPYFVISKNLETNSLVVSHTPPISQKEDKIALKNIILRTNIKDNDLVEVQTRYRQKPFAGLITNLTNESLTILPKSQITMTSLGQSCVLYQGDHCIGGGIIE